MTHTVFGIEHQSQLAISTAIAHTSHRYTKWNDVITLTYKHFEQEYKNVDMFVS